MRWLGTTCMQSPAKMYSLILSTQALKGASPNSLVGWVAALPKDNGMAQLWRNWVRKSSKRPRAAS